MRTLNIFKPAFFTVLFFYFACASFLNMAQAQSAPITITSPQTGANLVVGQTYHITWNAQNASTVYIGYSFGPGSLNWIAYNIPNTGSYDWLVNVGNTTNTQLMIYVSNGLDSAYSGYVNIVQPTSASLLTPVPNSTINNTHVNFSWTQVSNAKAYLLKVGSSLGGDDYWNSGQITDAFDTTTSVTIPENGQTVYVSLATLVNNAWQVNQYTFNMASSVINITAPAAGTTFVPGQTYRIKWTSKNINTVSFGYSMGYGNQTWSDYNVSVNMPNNGYYDWTVNAGNMTYTKIRVFVIGYGNMGLFVSENYSGYYNVAAPNFIALAEKAILNYFTVLSSGADASAALSAMNTAIQIVPNQHDKQVVTAFYNNQLTIYLYQNALKTIGLYSATPNSTTLSTALAAVLQLQPYNNINALSGLGLYDDTLNQLMQAVSKVLPTTNNMTSITPPVKPDGSFGTDVKLDSKGDVFISEPDNAITGKGTIYEFAKNNNNVWTVINQIYPIVRVPADHFGRLFRVDGNTLVASSEPSNGLARVYLFNLQSNNKWLQNTYFELTTEAQVKSISKICLALTFNNIVVGLPEYGEYLIFKHVFDYTATTPQTLVSSRWDTYTVGFAPGATLTDLSASGLYIAAGVQLPKNNVPARGAVFILQGNISVTELNSEIEYSTNWNWDTEQTGVPGFGQTVRINQSPALSLPIGQSTITSITLPPVINKVSLAIGSPLENKGVGAVYTMEKTIYTPTQQLVWGNQTPVGLVMPSTAYSAGYTVAFNDINLLVSALNASAPSLVMVYQLNPSTNQWAWAYTLENSDPLFGSSLNVNQTSFVVGSPKAANDNNPADISQAEIVSPK